ncbi:MAG: ribonuclease P protein component [Chloroflexi bacterium]|nr:ribonuclease P protein component [Chloroflexota bacterium]
MQRKFRLTSSADFQRVRRLGKSYAHPLVVLVAHPNELQDQTRFGIAAGRRLGSAVKRNRAKRLLRAALQSYIKAVIPGWDVILIARQPLLQATFLQIQEAVAALLRRANLLQHSHVEERPSSFHGSS